MRTHGAVVPIHRFADVRVLVAHAAEELHRQNVRVAVDDAAHDERAPFGAHARELAELRHEVPKDQHVAHEPREDRNPEPPVGDGEPRERRHAIDADVPDRTDARHRALAQRARRLHDTIRDTAGKVVLKERPALTHDMPMALPADEARRARDQGVVTDRDVREDRERPNDEHERHHCEQQRQLRHQRRLPLRRLHQRHEPADEQRNDGIEEGNGEACGEHGRVPALRLPNEVPVERNQSFGRTSGWRTRGRGNVEVDDLH